MSWENVESLPNEPRVAADAGPFRAQSEPVLATRPAPDWLERARLSFGSTPDLPSERAGHEVLVTAQFVYVRRADGTRQRVARDALSGRREEQGRVIYGVRGAEDLALLLRPNCSVQAALDAQLTTEEEPIRVDTPQGAVIQALVTAGPLFAVWADIEVEGPALPYAREIITLVAGLTLLHALFLRTVRTRLDRVGLHRRFGLLHLFHEQLPNEAFTAVGLLSSAALFGSVRRHVQLHRSQGRPITVITFGDATLGTRALGHANLAANRMARTVGVPVLPHRWGWKPKK